ncbi:MAG: phosphomannomutase/phosphoglucomutase [Patescibacteria group bacterium]
MFPSEIFKAYDIRGTYPDQINKDFAYNLGRAAAQFYRVTKAIVGADNRLSSPELKAAVISGLVDSGVEVIDIGLASTPLFNFSVIYDDYVELGIMVTASHNPKEWNGFKFLDREGMPVGLDFGLAQIRDLMLANDFAVVDDKGQVEAKDYKQEYLGKIFSLVDVMSIKPLKVVVDTANAMGALLIDQVFEKLPVRVEYLNKELDGNYPNHEANPLKSETLLALQARVLEAEADLGVAFDGDADRIGFVDDQGRPIAGDITAAILAPEILRQHPREKVIYDLRSSWAVSEQIQLAGGLPIRYRVGRTLIIKKMVEERAAFAGELSGHFYYRDFFNIESADLTLLYLLELLSKKGVKLSGIVGDVDKYFRSGEINFEVKDKDAVLKSLKEKYSANAKDVSELDGIRIEFDDWWFNVRPSNTEPVIRLNLEAKSVEVMKEKTKEIENLIKS